MWIWGLSCYHRRLHKFSHFSQSSFCCKIQCFFITCNIDCMSMYTNCTKSYANANANVYLFVSHSFPIVFSLNRMNFFIWQKHSKGIFHFHSLNFKREINFDFKVKMKLFTSSHLYTYKAWIMKLEVRTF